MPGQFFPKEYEGWLTPKAGASPYKIIDDPALIRKKNAIRESLREEYLKRMYNPYRRATGVGGMPFDPALQRYAALTRTSYLYFRPGPRVWWFWMVCVIAPCSAIIYAQEKHNAKFAEKVAKGEIAYEDRIGKR